MYKIFLVEDEIVVRESIRDHIDWNKTEFMFVGEAPDGEIALPLIQEKKPDILLTDIKMPFMDGLELSSYIKKNMPWIKIIIISGHQEFEYAKEAISIGVEEYVIKPISSKDLLDILDKVARNIDSEKKQAVNNQLMNKYVTDSVEYMKEEFLNNLILGCIPSYLALDKARSYGLDIIGKFYRVLRINIGVEAGNDFNQYLFNIEQIIATVTEGDKNILRFKRSLNEMILLVKDDDRLRLEENCRLLTLEIEQRIKPNGYRVKIDIGSTQERIQGISKSFRDIESENKYTDDGLNDHYEDQLLLELQKLSEKRNSYSDFDDQLILNSLRLGNRKEVQETIENYFDHIKDKGVSIILNIYLAIRINVVISTFIRELGEDPMEFITKQNRLQELATQLDTPEKLRNYIEDSVNRVFDIREKRKNNGHYEIINNAKQYIDDQYADPNISLQAVANYVSVSPCHFSTVFSQETGETFVQYLTNARMRRAKELFNTTSMKSGEIALEIGYKDPHYFSYIFKKNVGCKPTDYKNR